MIEINCSIGVDEHGLIEALDKLIEAYAYLNWPLVITDTWLRDGQPIPHDIVHKAIWNYQHSHPHLPVGITFSTSSNPGFDTLMKNLVPDLEAGRLGIDPKYTQERFSLIRDNRNHVAPPADGKQAREFNRMLQHYAHYFDVTTWRWVYNTVRFT